jgi:selenide,water dikinase
MDASVTPLPDQPGLSLVQTTDFFYPLVDDPYLQVNNSTISILR